LEQFRQGAHELGAAAVVIRSADVDDDVQFKQVKELLGSGIDVLVFLPHDTGKAGRFIDAAHAKHVPVISYDRLVTNAPADLYIGFTSFWSVCFSRRLSWLMCPKAPTFCSVARRWMQTRKSFALNKCRSSVL